MEGHFYFDDEIRGEEFFQLSLSITLGSYNEVNHTELKGSYLGTFCGNLYLLFRQRSSFNLSYGEEVGALKFAGAENALAT